MDKYFYFELIVISLIFILYFGGHKYRFMKLGLMLVMLITTGIYLIWRTFYTLPTSSIASLIVGILLLAAEWLGFANSAVFYFLFSKDFKRPLKTVDDLSELPSIDVYIATYNESIDILKRTLVAATLLDYPDKSKVNVYVCDDGSRLSVKKICAEYGATHITRKTHEHAKAGNLNNALSITDGELILILDADMIPRQDMLMRMVGYFSNPKLAFIQAPQTFYNEDPYQFNLFAAEELGSDQDFFMRDIQQHKDYFNAVMFIGSNALFRRKALEDIGGFSVGVITEDMATGMLLHSRGWHAYALSENLASGLQPESFADMVSQRDRWGRGNIQVLRKWNPLKIKGLSLIQRIFYIDGILYWFYGLKKLIFILAPVCYLCFGVLCMNVEFTTLVWFWGPTFIASHLSFDLIAKGKQSLFVSNLYETSLSVHMSKAILAEIFFKKHDKFVVTNKGINTKHWYYNWRLAWPLFIIWILSLYGIIKAILILLGLPSSIEENSIYLNIFWAIYNLFSITLALFMCMERPRYRKAERFVVQKKAKVQLDNQQLIKAFVVDLSEYGAYIKLINYSTKQQKLSGWLLIDDQKIAFETQRITITEQQKDVYIGCKFTTVTKQQYSYLITQTYAQKSTQIVQPIKKHRMFRVLFSWIIKHKKLRSVK